MHFTGKESSSGIIDSVQYVTGNMIFFICVNVVVLPLIFVVSLCFTEDKGAWTYTVDGKNNDTRLSKN